MSTAFISTVKGLWRTLFSGFWFIPGLVSLLGPLLALLFLTIDHATRGMNTLFVFRGDSSDAISILATIAGSLITVAGLTFSITIVVLQLVASQFTPRALSSFLEDRITQIVAGGFIGIFAYSLLILTTVHAPTSSDRGFVPNLSVTAAIGLGFLGLVLLLLFIHHTGETIQVTHITARIAKQTLRAIDQRYPGDVDQSLDEDGPALVRTWKASAAPGLVYATRLGYVRKISIRHLLRDMARPGICFHLTVCPGDFVTSETVIAEIWPPEAADGTCIRATRHHIHIERERGMDQDARFGVRQLADIALRALSPAVNDPTTGVLCIKYLQAVFEHLVSQAPQSGVYRFSHGTSILVARYPLFSEYTEVFIEIGRYATDNARVVNILLAALTRISEIVSTLNMPERLDTLATIASAVAHPAISQASTSLDTAQIRERLKPIERVGDKQLQ